MDNQALDADPEADRLLRQEPGRRVPGADLRDAAGDQAARLVASGDVQKLQPYFGQTVEFPLKTTIPVKKGWIIGLTVPTWAPALAAGLGGDTSWRASRNKGQCDDSQTQTAQAVNQIGRYFCLYRTARIVYSARVISTP